MKKARRWAGDALLIGDDEIEDGRSVRVPMLLMDAAKAGPWRSGYALLSDAEVAKRQEARSAWIGRMSDAWRGPQRTFDVTRPVTVDRSVPVRDARAAARASYDAMVTRLGNAWRTPFGDGVQPSGHTRPGIDPREPSGVTDPDAAAAIEATAERTKGKVTEADVERDRQARHRAYAGRLENAWKMGR
jgi:hypothetical protein